MATHDGALSPGDWKAIAEMSARGAYSLAARFGASHSWKRATGYTEAETKILIALASCWIHEGANASAKAIVAVTKTGRVNLASELCALGLVVLADREGQVGFYALTEAGWAAVESMGVARVVDAGRRSA